MILLTRLPTRETYHAAMDVHSRISAEDARVINRLYSTALMNG